MAEISTTTSDTRKAGVRRSKKLSTRVDLTPMVDLGFLLITFFIFTTTLSEPAVLRLVMPADGPATNSAESASLTVMPVSGNKIFYYHGQLDKALQSGQYGYTSFDFAKGIGNIIRQKQSAMQRVKPGYKDDLILIIKPDMSARYQNLVSMLDEVNINGLKHYVLTDISTEEKNMLLQKGIKL